MSFIAVCLILAIALIRGVVKKKVKYQVILLIWQLLIIRLMLPIAIPSNLSAVRYVSNLFSNHKQEKGKDSRTVLENLLNSKGEGTLVNQTKQDGKRIFYGVWAVGGVGIAGFFVMCYLKMKKFSDAALPIKDERIEGWRLTQRKKVRMYVSDQITTPITVGIWKPKIVLPKSMKCSQQEMEHILTHELVHIQGKHLLWKRMMLVLLCIYWFNPLVWVMNHLLNKDIELACDERVIELLGKTEREFYALSLVRMAAEQTGLMMASGFSKNDVEERVRAIMKKNNKSKFMTVLALGIGVMSVSVSAATLDKGQGVVELAKQIKQAQKQQEQETDKIYEVKCGDHIIKRNDFTSTWELDGKEVHIIFDEGGHWHVNNQEEALENNIRIRILRNENKEIIGVEDLTDEEIKELAEKDGKFNDWLEAVKQ